MDQDQNNNSIIETWILWVLSFINPGIKTTGAFLLILLFIRNMDGKLYFIEIDISTIDLLLTVMLVNLFMENKFLNHNKRIESLEIITQRIEPLERVTQRIEPLEKLTNRIETLENRTNTLLTSVSFVFKKVYPGIYERIEKEKKEKADEVSKKP